MRQLLCSISLIALLIPNTLHAQQNGEPLQLSLDDAMNLAVKNNVQAKNARLDRMKQKAINDEVRGLALPQVSTKGEYNQYPDPVKSFLPGTFFTDKNGQPLYPPGTFVPVQFTPKYSATASATATQILFDGSVMVALQAREALLELYDRQTQYTEEQIRYNIQKGYFALVVAEKQYETMKETMQYIRTIGRETKAYYDNGFTEKIDVDRISVQVNNLAADSTKVGNLIAVSKQMLKYQLGIDMEIPIILTDTAVGNAISEANQMLLDEVKYTDRTDYMLLKTQKSLNEYDLKRHHLSALPSLAAFGTAAYTYQTNDFSKFFGNQYVFYTVIGLQLKVPIFDGWQRRSRVSQAKISLTQTENNIDNLKRGIDLENKQYKTTLKNALYTLDNQERNFSLAKSVLETTREKYKAGVGSSMEVSQAQTEMLNAQSNYFQAMLDVINAQSDLRKAMGQFK
ncbi:MAG: TolC family protein [Chitinophagales bacterium]|nr:TolC family protein [Chitinophagales bacterium]